jgi:hypothetical protein
VPVKTYKASGGQWLRLGVPAPDNYPAVQIGVTHTQHTCMDYRPGGAAGQAVLAATPAMYQNQHIMAFGALNPEPSSGQYNWESLDDRMAMIDETNGTHILTAAVAPDWMKGGQPGETDYSKVEVAPLPEHFQDFADLIGTAVARYPSIKYVQVWNELKGFYNDSKNRWDYEGYTQMYNLVYQAVKSARASVIVGGPYISIDSWAAETAGGYPSDVRGPWGIIDQRSLDVITYWLQNKVDADFVCVDGGSETRDAGLITDPVTSMQKFSTIVDWIQQRTDLPVWWSEFYPRSADAVNPLSQEAAAIYLAGVAAFVEAGGATALMWSPEEDDSLPYSCLFSSTDVSSGGQASPLAPAWQWLQPRLAAGSVRVVRDTPLIHFAASDGQLTVNPTGSASGGLAAYNFTIS